MSDYAEVSKRRTLGSNVKITFTGAFSMELWEVHSRSSGLGSEGEVQEWYQ